MFRQQFRLTPNAPQVAPLRLASLVSRAAAVFTGQPLELVRIDA